MNVQTAINDALALVGYNRAAGRGANASELERGLRVFNRMVDSSNTTRAHIFTERIDIWNTTAQQQVYKWGPGGDWDGPRPQRMTRANLLLATNPAIRRKLEIWDEAQWAAITLQAIYTYPHGVYSDGAHPQTNVYFHPAPDAAYQIETYSWQANAPAQTLDTLIVYPPGYEEYWLNGLAVRLAPLHGVPVPPDVRAAYIAAETGIQHMNTVAPKLTTDRDFGGRGRGLYNWLTGLRNED